ncbi:MAG: AF1514 family protein [Desulfosoma sp.]
MMVPISKTCIPLEKSMLENVVNLTDRPETLSFDEARRLADHEAAKRSKNPMLLAWYDRRRGLFSPNVECCEPSKPAWLVYAQSRGADCTIAVNDLDYVFLYRSTE